MICQLRPAQLGEYGVYSLDIGKCQLETEVEPINMYLRKFTLHLPTIFTQNRNIVLRIAIVLICEFRSNYVDYVGTEFCNKEIKTQLKLKRN